MKHLDVAVAIVFRDAKILIARRKAGGVLGGYWEFPGGKVEGDESLHDCVRRELLEELGIRVQPVISFAPIQHQYADRHITLHAFLCTWTEPSVTPRLHAADEIRWVAPIDLQSYVFPPANQALIQQVIAAFPNAPVHASAHGPLNAHGPVNAVVEARPELTLTLPKGRRPRQPATV
jgi:mutator protein MutT